MKTAKSNLQPIAHYSSRAAALDVLHRIFDGAETLDAAFEAVVSPSRLSAVDRGFLYRMLSEALRHKGAIDALLATYMQKPLKDSQRPVYFALCIGVVQLLLLDTPSHAAVNETVKAIADSKFAPLKGLVNAILQRVSREKSQAMKVVRNTEFLLPGWIKQRWQSQYGDEQLAALSAMLTSKPPLDITLKQTSESFGPLPDATSISSHTLRISGDVKVRQIRGFDEGQWWVQDVASTQAVEAFGDVTGKRVLDLCAAPGGKTAQLLARGATVTALDVSDKRLDVLRENMKRLGFSPEIRTADIRNWKPDSAFDAVLLDAPCSATGTFRKHPEVLWLRTQEDISRMVELQRECLESVLRWLSPHVPLVYAVCSLEKEEGEQQIENLLRSHPELSIEPIVLKEPFSGCVLPNGTARLLPTYLMEQGGTDGFFLAKIIKNK
jgi:16S rRNA (cytosine967-C5)-methyltransferase